MKTIRLNAIQPFYRESVCMCVLERESEREKEKREGRGEEKEKFLSMNERTIDFLHPSIC